MIDCILDGVIDTLKVIPFLFLTFLLLEFIEHKLEGNNKKILTKNEKYGPLIGGILGALPQCGFSSMAANLFSARVISIGTLIAVFLSTSDEMLPIMLSEKLDLLLIIKILLFKIIIAIVVGCLVDFIYKHLENATERPSHITEICDEEHCSCDRHGLLLPSLIHTIKISAFILIANLLINIVIFYIGEDNLSELLLNNNIFTYFVSSLIGLIPNCAGSVIITELYLAKVVSLGVMLAGLLTGSGIGLLLLFRANKNIKENIYILTIIYLVGAVVGFIVDLIV